MLPRDTNTTGGDRRRRRRFPIDTELRYEVRNKGGAVRMKGTGRVQDISSEGLAFRSDQPLEPNVWLHVSMAWPARLDNQIILRLVFEGPVLRTNGDLVVVIIGRPEFRTAGKSCAAAKEEMQVLALCK